jgi:PAS domain S-box-containing protein
MRPADLPPDEHHRLTVLRQLGVLDSDAEEGFDALARTAARLTGCPIALISFVDETRQWFKAAFGLDLRETPREASFCAHAILGEGLFQIRDTLEDPRFAGNPLVLGEPHIRFYAGVPLHFNGVRLGTLNVIDRRPRMLTEGEIEALQNLARIATELLRSRQRLAALQAEQQRLEDFSRASGDWMWETDAQLRFTWLSSDVEAVTGQSAASLVGQPLATGAQVDEGGDQRAQPSLVRLVEMRSPFSRVVTEETTPRGLMCISRSAVPVFDEDGAFRGYRGTARDITSQIRSARRSRTHDLLLRKLSSQVPGVIFQFRMDRDGRFSYPYASDGLQQMFGADVPFDSDDGDPSLPLRVLHPDDRAGFMDSIRDSARRLQHFHREYRIVRRDGGLRWLETRATPERTPDGATLWHGFTADITERKEIEIALRRSEERWEMAADAAGIGIAEADLAVGMMAMDRRACINHGLPYPLQGYTLAHWLETMEPADRETVDAGLQHALVTRTTLETRYRLRKPDSRHAVIEITVRGRYGPQGQPTGLVGTCRDVTAQHAFERMQRDKEAAERANRAKSEFLSRVSHELRTPLNGILGFAQVMALDRVDALAPAQQRRLASVESAGRRLLGLINDVLDLTRIENEDLSLRVISVDAWSAIAECIALIQPLADEAGVRLMPLGERAPVRVKADPRALEQVLVNLLSNAIKYNRPGGRVEFEVTSEAGRVRIGIRDEGRGLTPQQQASLFQPFNRLGAENSRTEGSGLGLVICQRLALAMDGALHVHSRPGSGSTFAVELPEGVTGQSAPMPLQDGMQWPRLPSTGPRQVLYIEDEPLNMVLMEEVFRTQPEWTLLVAEDGATGERIARESRPDLVLVDMNLPDTNGLALIRRLRGDPRTRTLRCIALSADAMQEQITAALTAGFDEYWTKPIDVRKVLSDLTRLLTTRHAAS